MQRLIHAVLGAICLLAGQALAADPVLGVSEAWVREAPPGADVLVGYLTLHNLGSAYRDLGRVEEAIEHYQQALVIARKIGDRRDRKSGSGGMPRPT